MLHPLSRYGVMQFSIGRRLLNRQKVVMDYTHSTVQYGKGDMSRNGLNMRKSLTSSRDQLYIRWWIRGMDDEFLHIILLELAGDLVGSGEGTDCDYTKDYYRLVKSIYFEIYIFCNLSLPSSLLVHHRFVHRVNNLSPARSPSKGALWFQVLAMGTTHLTFRIFQGLKAISGLLTSFYLGLSKM